MRTVADLNHPGVVPHFHVDGESARRLNDLIVVVVAGAEHRHAAGHAPLTERDVLGAIIRMESTICCLFGTALLRLWRGRRELSVFRVGDERRAFFEPAPDDPERVVVARRVGGDETLLLAEDITKRRGVHRVAECGVGIALEQLSGGSLHVAQFLVGQHRAALQLIRPLQRCGGIVLPRPRQVGMTIGSARRCVTGHYGRSAFRPGRLAEQVHAGQRHRNSQGNEHGRDETSLKHRPLQFLRLSGRTHARKYGHHHTSGLPKRGLPTSGFPGPPKGGHYDSCHWARLKADTRHWVRLKADTRRDPPKGGHYCCLEPVRTLAAASFSSIRAPARIPFRP